MSSEVSIIEEIEKRIRSAKEKNYSIWTIGVTDDPVRRFDEHDSPNYWLQWNADSETAARNVEKYFLEKGMKGGEGGPGSADYVYIF